MGGGKVHLTSFNLHITRGSVLRILSIDLSFHRLHSELKSVFLQLPFLSIKRYHNIVID